MNDLTYFHLTCMLCLLKPVALPVEKMAMNICTDGGVVYDLIISRGIPSACFVQVCLLFHLQAAHIHQF